MINFHYKLKAITVLLISTYILSLINQVKAEPVILQITMNTSEKLVSFPSVNDRGIVVFSSNADLVGQNPDGGDDLFVFRSPSTIEQITNLAANDLIGVFRISGRSNVIVFSSNANPLGKNADHNNEIFTIRSNGSELKQITDTQSPVENTFPSIDPKGEVTAYQCTTPDKDSFNAEKICLTKIDSGLTTHLTEPDDFQFSSPTITSFPFIMVTPVEGNYLVAFSSNKRDLVKRSDDKLSNSFEIFTADVSSSLGPLKFSQLTFTPSSDLLHKFTPRISEEGNRVAFVNSSNRKNSDGSFTPVSRIDTVNTDGSELTMLYSDFEECGDPTINSDGSIVVFSCKKDFTGENPDGNTEVFLSENRIITQITKTTSGDNLFPFVGPVGNFIVWESTSDISGFNPNGRHQVYLFSSMINLPSSDLKPNISVPPGLSFVDTRVAIVTNADFNITNTGEGDLIVTAINADPNVAPISLGATPNLPFTLRKDESVKVGVVFAPTAVGRIMSTVTIESNDPDTPKEKVELFGLGIQPELTGKFNKVKDKVVRSQDGFKFVIDSSIIVKNVGSDDSGPFGVAVFLSEDKNLDPNDELLKELPAGNLPPQKGSLIKEKFERTTSSRGKFLIMHIDNLEQVIEVNENNNVIFKRIR